jgi:hypothetical protein
VIREEGLFCVLRFFCNDCGNYFNKEKRLDSYMCSRVEQLLVIDSDKASEAAASRGLFFQTVYLHKKIELEPRCGGIDVLVSKEEFRLYQDRMTKRRPTISGRRLPAISLGTRENCVFFRNEQIDCIRNASSRNDRYLLIKQVFACKSPEPLLGSHVVGITGIKNDWKTYDCVWELWRQGLLILANDAPGVKFNSYGEPRMLGELVLKMPKHIAEDILNEC